jgi:hypothetical protein
MSAYKFNTIDTLRDLQQARGHAVLRTPHAQLLHNSGKQQALDSCFCFNFALTHQRFGRLKQRQNRGNNRITPDGYFHAVEKQHHPALAESRLQLCGMRVRMYDQIVKCKLAPGKRFRQDDVRTHLLTIPTMPEVIHYATQNKNALAALTKLRSLAMHSWRGSECRNQMEEL